MKNVPHVLTTQSHYNLLHEIKEWQVAEDLAKSREVAQRDARQDALQRQDEQWKRINDEYELAKKNMPHSLRHGRPCPGVMISSPLVQIWLPSSRLGLSM